jgi:hypothetical protein
LEALFEVNVIMSKREDLKPITVKEFRKRWVVPSGGWVCAKTGDICWMEGKQAYCKNIESLGYYFVESISD